MGSKIKESINIGEGSTIALLTTIVQQITAESWQVADSSFLLQQIFPKAMISYSTALFLTLGIECLVVAVFKLVADKALARSTSTQNEARITFLQWTLVAIGANLFSHPLAWTAVSADLLSFYWVEFFVIVIEAAIYRVLLVDSNSKAVSLSLAANLASMLVGFVAIR